jgi:hypothetical protein
MKITLERAEYNGYLVIAEDGQDMLVQLDYDFCSLAKYFGWSPSNIATYEVWDSNFHGGDAIEVVFSGTIEECDEYMHAPPFEGNDRGLTRRLMCDHDDTDGTIDCDCGMNAMKFINDAQKWLDDHEGAVADDPGYFTESEDDEVMADDQRDDLHMWEQQNTLHLPPGYAKKP